jgi:diacylglycerol kinase (ATP)
VNGALRAAHAGSDAHDARVNHDDRDDHDDHEAASVEPFDSISESAAMNHAEAHRMSGHEGHARHSRVDGDGDESAGINRHGSHAAAEIQHEPLSPDDPLAPLPFNPYKGNRGLTRAWHAMKNSLAGFRVAIREESAFRQELTLAAILLPCGVLVPVEPVSRVAARLGAAGADCRTAEFERGSGHRPYLARAARAVAPRERPGQRRGDGRARHVRDDVGADRRPARR